MRKSALAILLPIIITVTVAQIQPSAAINHGVKLGFTGLFMGNSQLTYAYILNDHSAINVTGSLFIPRKAPFGITERISKVENQQITKDRFTGYAAGLDYRIYLSHKGPSRGFYFGPFVRYYRYHIAIESTNTQSNSSYEGKIGLSSFSGGVQLGAQWLIKEHYCVDFGFFGIGVSGMSVFGKFQSDGGILSAEDRETIAEGLRESGFGFLENAADKLLAQDGDAKFTYPFFGIAWRSFIRIGYYF